MAIGTAAAIGLGIAGIGAGASAISSNSASKRAAQTSQTNTDANVALARDIYGQNRDLLNPFVQRGNQAGDAMNALLGLGGSQQMGGPQAVTIPGAPANALSQFRGTNTAAGFYGLGDAAGFSPTAFSDWIGNSRGASPFGVPSQPLATNATVAPTNVVPTAPQGQTPQQAAEGAFDTFRNSTGYQFRLGEGLDAVGSAYAGIGGLQSGAAMRGINEYGQNFASNEFGNYVNALSGQQAVGAGAASSAAGVGQNFAGTVIGQNNFNATNQMNAQLGQQNPLANVFGTVGGAALGFLGGR